jgi:CHAP domain
MSHPMLFLGSNDVAVQTLIGRLRAEGFWEEAADVSEFTLEVEDSVRSFQRTHLGPDGTFLSADGVVGEKTWWALFNSTGRAQRSGLRASVPDGLGPMRQRILTVALAEHARDVVEVPNGSNRGPDVDRYLPDWVKKPGQKGPAWCCFFYSWVAHQALDKWPLGAPQGGVLEARRVAGKLGLWTPKSVAVNRPLPGDVFVMDRGSGHGHIGFVLRVSDDRKQINTLEGNCGNRVKLGMRELSDPEIIGFIDNVPSENNTVFELGIADASNLGRDRTV